MMARSDGLMSELGDGLTERGKRFGGLLYGIRGVRSGGCWLGGYPGFGFGRLGAGRDGAGRGAGGGGRRGRGGCGLPGTRRGCGPIGPRGTGFGVGESGTGPLATVAVFEFGYLTCCSMLTLQGLQYKNRKVFI